MKTVLKYKLDYVLHDGFRRVVCEDIEDTQVISIFIPKIDHSDIDNIEDDLRKIKSIALHRMPSWEKGFVSLDITDGKVSKLHAISDIFKILNIESHEAIGVGDSYNDYPLLMACGLKIAMGNAVSELKEIADFIAPSVEDDGVATVIEKYILNS